MSMSENHHFSVPIHVKRQMHQFEIDAAEFKIVRFLNEIVLGVVLNQTPHHYFHKRQRIAQTAVFELFEDLRFDNIPRMDQKFGPLRFEVIDARCDRPSFL
jgi:hypothetical protein